MSRVPDCKTPVLRVSGSSYPIIRERFSRFVDTLNKLYGLSLRPPDLSDNDQLRQFCTGLLESDDNHPWRPLIGGLGAQARFGLKHSLFLFRKVIPKEKPKLTPYVEKISSPQGDPDPEFSQYAVKLCQSLFPQGWDSAYRGHGFRSFYSTSSCAERSRMEGGGRSNDALTLGDRAEFCSYVLLGRKCRGSTRCASIVQAVETGGKWRVVASPPAIDNALRAFHLTMYDFLSRKEWLLRGDATPSSFKGFTRVPGEVFVSGDYESATDNLNGTLQRLILSTVFGKCDFVPQEIQDHALSTFSSSLRLGRRGKRVWEQRRGQLMGQLISFPLLCLVNYITFRYSFRGGPVPPVRVNGDDIVFRSTPDGFKRWERNVAKGGLTLSKGKTLVHSRGFTLNSTPFWSTFRGPKKVGFIRSSAIWSNKSPQEDFISLGSRFYSSSSGFGGQRRGVVQSLFLSENRSTVSASRRSVTRGLGLAVGPGVLKSSGLWDRELFYLGQAVEPELPPPPSLGGAWERVSRWTLTSDEIRAWERLRSCAFVDARWDSTELTCPDSDFFERVQAGCSPYGVLPGWNKALVGKFLRGRPFRSARDAFRFCRNYSRKLVSEEDVLARVKVEKKEGMVWVLKDRSYPIGRKVGCVIFRNGAGERWGGSESVRMRLAQELGPYVDGGGRAPLLHGWMPRCGVPVVTSVLSRFTSMMTRTLGININLGTLVR